jgi:hypothetical protein
MPVPIPAPVMASGCVHHLPNRGKQSWVLYKIVHDTQRLEFNLDSVERRIKSHWCSYVFHESNRKQLKPHCL